MSRATEILDMTEDKNWSAAVTARKPSTFPPPGTFTKSGEEIAEIMAKPSVSPNGIGSAIQMIQFFINRAGEMLKPERKTELEKAISILQGMKKE